MQEAVIVDAVRTHVGRRNGVLADWHPADLLARTISTLVERNNVAPDAVDDVIAGCVLSTGDQYGDIARTASLSAGLAESVPGVTLDRQCGSGQQAVHFAAQGVMSGSYEIAIACGVEMMSRVDLGPAFGGNRPGAWLAGEAIRSRYGDRLANQGLCAERVATAFGLSRHELDQFSFDSHLKAAAAWEEGRFDTQLVDLHRAGEGTAPAYDEGIRSSSSLDRLATLPAVFQDDGVVTAGNSSQISDGAAAVLVMERDTAERHGLRPRARIASMSVIGDDPRLMLTGPIPATRMALDRAGLGLDDIDLFEVNEAFACVPLAWAKETGADLANTNVNGGSIAVGHPIGSTGARLITQIVHELERRQNRYGLVTVCEGGGMANATVIERIA